MDIRCIWIRNRIQNSIYRKLIKFIKLTTIKLVRFPSSYLTFQYFYFLSTPILRLCSLLTDTKIISNNLNYSNPKNLSFSPKTKYSRGRGNTTICSSRFTHSPICEKSEPLFAPVQSRNWLQIAKQRFTGDKFKSNADGIALKS